MHIDTYTLAIILGGASLIQAIILLFQFLLNRDRPGPGWWVVWAIFTATGWIGLLMWETWTGLNFEENTILSQIIIVTGQIFLNIGILRFLGKRESIKMILWLMGSILGLSALALLVERFSPMLAILLSWLTTFVSLLNARDLQVQKRKALNASVNFLAGVFVFHGVYFFLQSINQIFFQKLQVPLVDTATLLTLLVTGTLWSFGLIIMFNQSLIAENRESRENLEAIINTSPDSISVIRVSDGRFVDFNDAFLDLSGYSRSEALERSTVELNLWQDPAQRLQIEEMLAERGSCEYMEAGFRRKDGSIIDALIFAKIINLQGIPHIMSVGHDMTSRKRNESQLRRLNTVVEQSQVSVLITDVHGTIEYVNPQLSLITGYSEAELIGGNPKILKSGNVPETSYRELWETILAGGTWRGRFHNRRKDGSLFWESAVISPIVNEQGSITNFVAVKQDITDQIQAEAALLKLTAVEERQRLARDLHDSVNQSIHGMVLFSETLVSTLEKQNIERGRQIAERLQESARQALKETRLMLYQLQPSGVEDRIDLVRDLETRLLMVERHAGLRAQIVQEGSVEHCPAAWQENLFWIAIEALNNALKHAQARNVQILFRWLPSRVGLEISDDGIGFDPARPRNGGLGLQNMQDRARILGGEITFHSGDRQGTRVIFNADIVED